MTFTDHQIELIVAATAAVSAIVVALLSAFVARAYVGRDRRRHMYGEAFRAALEWREMLYRVRRRDNTKENDRTIVEQFHELQERLDFYEGWIGSESRYMRQSFTRLVNGAKNATQKAIRTAWDNPGKQGNLDEVNHPAIDQGIVDGYLRDVRSHLSLQPWRWIAVAWRNRESRDG